MMMTGKSNADQQFAPKVLLVEDEILISELVREALMEQGFRVQVTENGEDALRFLEDDSDVDILFTDINVLGGINGAELASRARKLRPDLPIVYASGRYKSSDLGALVPRSIFVHKPYNVSDLCVLFHRLAHTTH